MSNMEKALLNELSRSKKFGSRPEAPALCADAAEAITKHHKRTSAMMEKAKAALPTDKDVHLRSAQMGLEKLSHAVEKMTDAQRRIFAVRVLSPEVCALLGIDRDAPITEFQPLLDKITAVLIACDPQPLPRTSEKKAEPKPMWVAHVLAECWRRHFNEEPKVSANSPFLFLTNKACESLGKKPPSHDTISDALAEWRDAPSD